MDRFDDEDEIPSGMRREIERLKGPPAMPRPDGPRAAEITPVLSPGQTRRSWSPPEEKPLLGVRPMPEDASVSFLELKGIGEGTTVLHAPSGVVGVVKRVYGPGEYRVAPKGVETSGRPVSEPVVELEDGNAFLLRRGSLVMLGGKAAEFHSTIVSHLSAWLGSTARFAAREGIDREAGLAIVRAVLSTQLRALNELSGYEDAGYRSDSRYDANGNDVRRPDLDIPTDRTEAEREADRHFRECVDSDEVG